jgi:hypothetical protein
MNDFCPTPKQNVLVEQFHQLIKREQLCIKGIRNGCREKSEILNLRKEEESGVELVISLHDTIRNKTVALTLK